MKIEYNVSTTANSKFHRLHLGIPNTQLRFSFGLENLMVLYIYITVYSFIGYVINNNAKHVYNLFNT